MKFIAHNDLSSFFTTFTLGADIFSFFSSSILHFPAVRPFSTNMKYEKIYIYVSIENIVLALFYLFVFSLARPHVVSCYGTRPEISWNNSVSLLQNTIRDTPIKSFWLSSFLFINCIVLRFFLLFFWKLDSMYALFVLKYDKTKLKFLWEKNCLYSQYIKRNLKKITRIHKIGLTILSISYYQIYQSGYRDHH